jgi:hypothetical protein
MKVESPFGTSVDGKCSACHEDLDGSEWPDDTNGLLCQMCWESACSKSWWKMVNDMVLKEEVG